MKLYYTRWRWGTRVDSFWKPKEIKGDTKEVEKASLDFMDYWFEPLRRDRGGDIMPYADQFRYYMHFVRLGIYTLGLSGPALKSYILGGMQSITYLPQAAGWVTMLGSVAVVGLAYLTIVMLIPPTRSDVYDFHYWPYWLMTYQGRVWAAQWTGHWVHGMPIFQQRDEIGDIIAFESRNCRHPKFVYDDWDHVDCWMELEGYKTSWHHFTWHTSMNTFCGYMTGVGPGLYGLRKEYHKLPPPVSDW